MLVCPPQQQEQEQMDCWMEMLLLRRGPPRLALIPKEDGERGWAEILKIIAERDHIATRKRKRGVFFREKTEEQDRRIVSAVYTRVQR